MLESESSMLWFIAPNRLSLGGHTKSPCSIGHETQFDLFVVVLNVEKKVSQWRGYQRLKVNDFVVCIILIYSHTHLAFKMIEITLDQA